MSTCRFCHGWQGDMVKYGVRHYAHLGCALDKLGSDFLDRLTTWQLGQLSFMDLSKRGLLGHVRGLIARRKAEGRLA